MQDRSWAVGLTQEQFEIEFIKRGLGSDVIPTASEWAIGSEPVYHGIDPPNLEAVPEKTVLEGEELLEKKTSKKHLGYPCRGCGRVFDYPVARAGHERRCKQNIQKEAV
jgi:hypothetical protein